MELIIGISALIVSFLALKPVYDRLQIEKARKHKKALLFNKIDPLVIFVGREDELKAIQEWYSSSEKTILSVVGLGGQGKSSLIAKWFETIRDTKTIWWSVYDNRSVDGLFEQLLILFNEKNEEYITGSIHTKLTRLKEHFFLEKRLIIIDGFEIFQNPSGTIIDAQLRDLLKFSAQKGKVKIFVGTRFGLTNLSKYAHYQTMTLEGLSVEEVGQYFKSKNVLGIENFPRIEKICNSFDGHPLSISIFQEH